MKTPAVNDISKSIIKTYRKEIWKRAINGIDRYEMISADDKIAVCISGGKDSFLLALVMREIKRHYKVKFDLCYMVMDPGYEKTTINQINKNAQILDFKY